MLIGMYIAADHVKLRFSYDASGNVVAVDYSEDGGTNYTTYYYLRNTQNDIVKIVDSTGSTVVEYIYDSWGKIVSSTGSLANTVGTYQPFRYRGYVCDDELGLYYLQSRYYDPDMGRFISADVLLSTGQGVIGHNSFAYCLNTPINGFDPDGHSLNPFCNLVADGTGCGGSWTACYGGGAITIVVCGHKVTINANILLIAPDGYDEQFIESAIKKYYEGVFYGDDDYFDVSILGMF